MAVPWQWLLRPIFVTFSTIILIITAFPVVFSVTETEALLKLKSSFTNASALDSWVPTVAPCKGQEEQWKGLICYKGIITGLRVENMGLAGMIDVAALDQIPGLRTVSFANNSFSGTMPEFQGLKGLRAIYLTGNQFSGEIPPGYFDKMDALRKVWISNNKFTGPVPPSLFQLNHLVEMHIENNQFSGTIPAFKQPNLASLDLSNNKLEGEIPHTLAKFDGSAFSGNAGLCGKNVGVDCKESQKSTTAMPPPKSNGESGEKKEDNTKTVAGLITLGAILLSVAVVLILKRRRKRRTFDVLEKESVQAVEVQVSVSNRKEKGVQRKTSSSRRSSNHSRSSSNHGKGGGVGELVMVNDEKGVFVLSDLMKAAAEALGNGGLGSSYKAMMTNGVSVVVKRIREMNAMGREGFDAEIKKFGMLRHSNVMTPLAYHYRKDEKLLVYEFIPKGSLLYQLHGDRGPSHDELNWPARLKIVQGIASGMGYLHAQLASFDLPHGNLKSSNILLCPNNEPLITEYGFCPMINSAKVGQALFGYKAPEAVASGEVSPKCDVYCLGVVILEILTGKFPSQYLSHGKGGTDVVEWVASAATEGWKVTELLDPEIANDQNSLGEMEQLLHIGSACTESSPEKRLDMREAIEKIEQIQPEGGLQDPRQLKELPTLRDGCPDASQTNNVTSFQERHAEQQPGSRLSNIPDGVSDKISGR